MMIDEQSLREATKQSNNIFQICKLLNLRPTNINYDRIRKYIDLYGIDCSHFDDSIKTNPNRKIYNDEDLFKVHDQYISMGAIKKRLLRNNPNPVCEICGINSWNGKPIVLQVHHINGDRKDNRIENLQLLCPNCHSQTDNFCFHTKGVVEKPIFKKICIECGEEFETIYKYQRLCSKECKSKYLSRNIKIRINEDQFIKDLIECNGVINQLCKKYDVSFATIRNYCKRHNLPYKSNEIKKFLENYETRD